MMKRKQNDRARALATEDLEAFDRQLSTEIPEKQSFHSAVRRELRARVRRAKKAAAA